VRWGGGRGGEGSQMNLGGNIKGKVFFLVGEKGTWEMDTAHPWVI